MVVLVGGVWLAYRRIAHGETPVQVMHNAREAVPAWILAGYGLVPLFVWIVAASLKTGVPQGTFRQAFGFLAAFWAYLGVTIALPVVGAARWLSPAGEPPGAPPRRLLLSGLVACIVVVSMTVLVLAMGEMIPAS